MSAVRAAHFLLNPELATSPPNEALLSAFLEAGVKVDVFAPGMAPDASSYGAAVRADTAEYGLRWLARNMLSTRWRQYSVFSGTTEDPMAVAGVLAKLYRGRAITLADEIRSGSNSGNRGRRWKQLCRWGMRRSHLTIVNDVVRKELQRDYAGLGPKSNIIVYPGCFRNTPRRADRFTLRREMGITDDSLALAFSGSFSIGNGATWLCKLLRSRPDVHVYGQLLVGDPLVSEMLDGLVGAERLHRVRERLTWADAWSQVVVADIGMAIYLQDGPQFQNMGISSNRLCMFLAMGVPVIASRQPSFQFIEDYDCGVLVDNEAEFIAAIDRIAGRLDEMKANALRCAREYIDAPGKYLVLRDAIARLVGLKPEGKQS